MKTVPALLLVGMLILWAELPSGKTPRGTAWSCPEVHITCAMANPRNDCYMDWQCPRGKKCCQTFCGRQAHQPNSGRK
uniref:WAP domain-containing protein n=1 Tax=Phasianus colchicus TaxID=9054 RepID=A0A669NW94_PHACC